MTTSNDRINECNENLVEFSMHKVIDATTMHNPSHRRRHHHPLNVQNYEMVMLFGFFVILKSVQNDYNFPINRNCVRDARCERSRADNRKAKRNEVE